MDALNRCAGCGILYSGKLKEPTARECPCCDRSEADSVSNSSEIKQYWDILQHSLAPAERQTLKLLADRGMRLRDL